jgi:hypothetical protein
VNGYAVSDLSETTKGWICYDVEDGKNLTALASLVASLGIRHLPSLLASTTVNSILYPKLIS